MVLVDVDVPSNNFNGVMRNTVTKTPVTTVSTFATTIGGSTLPWSANVARAYFPNPTTPTGYQTAFEDGSSYFIFSGITIPQSAIINDATLTFNMQATGTYVTGTANVYGRKTATPVTPTNPSFFTAPRATAQGTFTISGAPTSTTSTQIQSDVQSIVQELVNTFDYNNDNMMFIMRFPLTLQPTTVTPEDNNAFFGSIAGFTGSVNIPNLTINYTLTAQTFTIDALIQALGVNGSCNTIDIDPSPVLDSIDLATTDVAIANNQKIGQRVTFTTQELEQIDQGIVSARVWFSGPSGSKLEWEIYKDADVGQGSETLVADGGGITFVGGTAMSKKIKSYFDVPITGLTPFKPQSGVEYVIAFFTSISSGTTRKASGGDVIIGELTGRTSAGNWTDVAGEDFSLQLVTSQLVGQHNCFEIDAQLIVAIPAQPFCINAILTSTFDIMCKEFTIDALIDDPDAVTEAFTIDALLFSDGREIAWIELEVPDPNPPQPTIQFTVDAILEITIPPFNTKDFIIDALITPDIGLRRDVGDLIVRVLFENPSGLTGNEIVDEIVIITDAEPQWGFRGKVSRIKNWIGFLRFKGTIEEDGSDPDWYETLWTLV